MDLIPGSILRDEIFIHLDRVTLAVARLTCKNWSKIITPVTPSVNAVLASAAKGGHEALCRLAKKWGAWEFNTMLISAAKGGHGNLCRLAKEWGATACNGMLTSATKGGHEHLCWLAKEWGATTFLRRPRLELSRGGWSVVYQ